MIPDLFAFADSCRRSHRGVETSKAAAEKAARYSSGDAVFALRFIGEHNGATFKEVNRSAGRDIQPRISCLTRDGYIEPKRCTYSGYDNLQVTAGLLKRENSRVMILTDAGRKLFEDLKA